MRTDAKIHSDTYPICRTHFHVENGKYVNNFISLVLDVYLNLVCNPLLYYEYFFFHLPVPVALLAKATLAKSTKEKRAHQFNFVMMKAFVCHTFGKKK